MIGEFKDIAMKTIQNETQKKKKILKEKWTEHRWTVEKFQVAKYTCNWSPQGEEVTEKVSEEIIYWNFSNVMKYIYISLKNWAFYEPKQRGTSTCP